MCFDDRRAFGHILMHLGPHMGMSRFIICPARTAMFVRMRHMHGRGNITVKSLRGGKFKWRFWCHAMRRIALGDKGKNSWRFS